MRELHGVGVANGRAAGPVVVLRSCTTTKAGDALEALNLVADELTALAEEVGGHAEEILIAQAQIARDPAVAAALQSSTDLVVDPAIRLAKAFAPFRARLAASGSGYMQERVADIDEIVERASSRLRGEQASERQPPVPGILVGAEVSPADTARIPKRELLGIISAHGGTLSHAAILARALGIPAIVGLGEGIAELHPGAWIELDGDAGTVTVLESSATRRYVHAQPINAEAGKGGAVAMADGHPVDVQANIGSLDDVEIALTMGLRGSGLVRTEFLFAVDAAPDIDDQAAVYRKISEALPDGVVFRLLDCGADKPLSYVPVPSCPNPALGQRGVRVLLANRELLESQLKALSRSSKRGVVRVMVPMLTDVSELQAVREIAAPIFAGAGVELALGAMIEVPTAALSAPDLAGEAEFLSIGTNDLIQYLCAADRSAAELTQLIDPVPLAVWRLLREVIDAGVAAGIPVGVCGELAGDPIGAGVLAAVGASSLSVSPARVSTVARDLSKRTLEDWRRHADELLAESSASRQAKPLPHERLTRPTANGSPAATSARRRDQS